MITVYRMSDNYTYFSVGSSTLLCCYLHYIITAPLLVSAEPEQEATVGGPAELRCTVQSFPLPRLTWIRVESNGGAETELLEQDREFDDDFGVYRIANVTESDAGDYICRGEYLFANEELPITLIVLGEFLILQTERILQCH